MIQTIMMFLLAATASLNAHNAKALVAGEVSPAGSKGATSSDSEDTGEADRDVIITDEDDSDDDEGVEN